MSTLRRIACIRWLPPMLSAVAVAGDHHTWRSGRTVFRPVAMAGARPWMPCTP